MSTDVSAIDENKRRANRRLAIILAIVAGCFYVGMLFLSPLS